MSVDYNEDTGISNLSAAQSLEEWNLSVKIIIRYSFQICQLPDLWRNGTCQLIMRKIQVIQILKLPNLRRNGTCQLIIIKISHSNSPAAQSRKEWNLSVDSLSNSPAAQSVRFGRMISLSVDYN